MDFVVFALATFVLNLLSIVAADDLSWYSCSSYSGSTDERFNGTVSCLDIEVPYSYASEDSDTFSYHLTRYIPPNYDFNDNNNKPKNYLWMIAGGPGLLGSDSLTVSFLETMNDKLSDFIFILPDHRGCGLSSPLQCPNDTTIYDGTLDCLNYLKNHFGENYFEFTISNAATDIYTAMNLIHSDKGDYDNIYLLGSSYGGNLIDRVLLLYPNFDLINGVIYDSALLPHFNWIYSDITITDTSNTFLTFCEIDTFCSSKFVSNYGIKQAIDTFYSELDSNTQQCVKVSSLFQYISNLKQYFQIFFWALINVPFLQDYVPTIPSVLYRFDKCSQANDIYDLSLQTWFFKMISLTDGISEQFGEANAALQHLIVASELAREYDFETNNISEIFSYSEFEEIFDKQIFTGSSIDGSIGPRIETYEMNDLLYTPDVSTWHVVSNSSHARLLMQGTMDLSVPQWTLSDLMLNERTLWNYALFPLKSHTMLTYGVYESSDSCFWRIFKTFLKLTKKSNEPMNNLQFIQNKMDQAMKCICYNNYPFNFDWQGKTDAVKNASISAFGTQLWDF